MCSSSSAACLELEPVCLLPREFSFSVTDTESLAGSFWICFSLAITLALFDFLPKPVNLDSGLEFPAALSVTKFSSLGEDSIGLSVGILATKLLIRSSGITFADAESGSWQSISSRFTNGVSGNTSSHASAWFPRPSVAPDSSTISIADEAVCLRDTFIPDGRKLRDPRRLYAPGRMYHIVERKFCRCGRFPPEVRTAIPVDGRFEHIVLLCNATSDHAIIWIERESESAKFQAIYEKFSKEKATHLQTLKADSFASHLLSPNSTDNPARDPCWIAIRALSASPLSLSDLCVLKRLGAGDMGAVYLVKLRKPDPSVSSALFAAKVIDRKEIESRSKEGRLRTEREILEILDHPFVPTLYATIDSPNWSCLLMEFCPGGDLHVLRQRQHAKRFNELAVRFL
nr:serine/threonine-protein kinase D6PKL2-like [Ipomoea batatas]